MWRICVLLLFVEGCMGQVVEDPSCYGAGSIAASVIVTFIVTILLVYVAYEIWRRYWIKRKRKHLVLETDPERGKNDYAYDNAAFGGEVTSTPADKSLEKNGKLDSTKSKWSQWSPLGALITKNERKTSDDSALQTDEIKIVSLKSHDFTGLGFNIYGNMRDGIFIKDILHRGPASESGKLNPGDRIRSVTINFEHVVYEDALTILSYASPYEVTLEAQSGKTSNTNNQHMAAMAKTVHLGHPLYRSSSMTDLIQIQKTSKRRLFPTDDSSNVITNLQKTLSNMTTLERKHSGSPKTESPKTHSSSPQQLKSQLEQKILHNYKHQLKTKDEKPKQEIEPSVPVKTENKYQKFGIKVLPMAPLGENLPKEQTSPKSAELSQNDNNINLERHMDKQKVVEENINVDEVDVVKKVAPPVKRREKSSSGNNDEENNTSQTSIASDETIIKSEPFTRQNGSGIRRDKDGIPQEIPSHMLNAAVAAKRNRKGSNENVAEDVKSPKKQKGRAPAPPNDKTAKSPNDVSQEDEAKTQSGTEETSQATSDKVNQKESTDYVSDSDAETDNRSSVNTIELNASDITIHQTEDSEDMQNRRTASTGDLTKIQKTYKTNTGTLERAQSLDITDSGVPTMSKKRKSGSIEENLESKSGSDDSLYGKAKEPRLSLALDGLNTFQRNRLKKSTEWGNLEDAILNMDTDQSITEIQTDTVSEDNDEKRSNSITVNLSTTEFSPASYQISNQSTMVVCNTPNDTINHEQKIKILLDNQERPPSQISFVSSPIKFDDSQDKSIPETPEPSIEGSCPNSFTQEIILVEEKVINEPIKLFANSVQATESFLDGERELCSSIDPYYNVSHKLYDTNVSDDIKVSRHSLQSSLETLDNSKSISTYNGNVSNITISDKSIEIEKPEKTIEGDDLYITALDTTVIQDNNSMGYEKMSVTLPSLTDSNETVTVEGPTSLTLEISSDGIESPIISQISNQDFQISPDTTTTATVSSPKSNYSLTYITEIQVTPSNTKNASDPIVLDVNKDKKAEASLKNFKANIKHFESQIQSNNSTNEKIDPQKELHKIHEIAEEQLKKLPEMRFSTSSYESTKPTESTQVDQLRSNFEKSPPKVTPKPESAGKSRIPVATSKTPPTSPERRDSRNFDLEVDKDIVAIMSSPVHSTPISSNIKYQPKVANKNVSVTSIRSNSKIPSGFPNRPPVPPRKYDNIEYEANRSSTNGNIDSSFKQWVFSPNDSPTNVTVTENKPEHK
ncbi:hypothetical protein ILUMI_07344 [Ignelater luminosus]|uniref:PDZ domain-containing protein n=1 Tax=Ignelater luminosus TaxID=2038154 RepID=A0A8K0D7L5_IGNLU|nr:hypothetical protein ILUMI_07344 [Ignelater luminosus]